MSMEVDNCEEVRPAVDLADLEVFFMKEFSYKISSCEELKAFEDRNFYVEVEQSMDGDQYSKSQDTEPTERLVVKVTKCNTMRNKKWNSIKNTTKYLDDNGFTCAQVKSMQEFRKNDSDYFILILEFIPGDTLSEYWPHLDRTTVIKQTGEMVAELHNALKSMDSSTISLEVDPEDPWILDNAGVMLNLLDVIENKDTAEVVKSVIKNFTAQVMELKSYLQKGIIHGDLHDMNLIVNCQEDHLIPIIGSSSSSVKDLFGIIDFGDLCKSYYIFEVGQIIRDFMLISSNNCYDAAVTFLSGYLIKRTLNDQEIKILFPTILAALCQYYVIGLYEFRRQPDNPSTMEGSEKACQLILRYHNCYDEFLSNISEICNKSE